MYPKVQILFIAYRQFCGSAVLRFCGSAVLRFCGSAVLRCCGSAVLQCCGAAVLRCCGAAKVPKSAVIIYRSMQIRAEPCRTMGMYHKVHILFIAYRQFFGAAL